MVVISPSRATSKEDRQLAETFDNSPLFDKNTGRHRWSTRRRTNPHSLRDAPDGQIKCKHPGCNLFFPKEALAEDEVLCPAGHEFDRDAEEAAELKGNQERSHIGISRTDQGDIAELIVQELKFLGEFGQVSEWIAGSAPLDGLTDLGWGIEVKSINGPMAKNHAFTRCRKRSVERKNAEIKRRSLRGIVGVLVILDFDTSEAIIYLRGMDRMMYWERPQTAPFAVVDFEHLNPLVAAEKQAKLDLEGDDIPF